LEQSHKMVREILRHFTKPRAAAMLRELLPEREFLAVYYCDIEDWPRWKVGEEKLHCDPSQVSRIKRKAYKRLKHEFNNRSS